MKLLLAPFALFAIFAKNLVFLVYLATQLLPWPVLAGLGVSLVV